MTVTWKERESPTLLRSEGSRFDVYPIPETASGELFLAVDADAGKTFRARTEEQCKAWCERQAAKASAGAAR